MPIIDLQTRSRELGRIRIGVQVATQSGKKRPEKLDRFRITSASQALITRVAELYGGEAQPWDNNGSPQFEVITTSTRLPVLVPPQPISQWYELWSRGGCQRRCDGATEVLTDKPCICGPDPTERKCKPTTRLNVILRDVEGIGVWRLESHGYYSAVELPEVAAFLARAGGYVSAWLSLEQRTVVREGETRRWMVPILEVDVTPAQLMAGEGKAPGQLGTAPVAIETASPVLDAVDEPAPSPPDWAKWIADVQTAKTVDDLRRLWKFRPAETLPSDAEQVFTTCAATLRAAEEGDGPSVPRPEAEPLDDVDTLWSQVLTNAPEEWTTAQIEAHFTEITKVDPDKMTATDVQRYLDAVKNDQTSEGVQ